MKLYRGPHTCTIDIHFLPEEIGKPHETERIDVDGRATHRPPFSGLKPKGKVPAVVHDGGIVLTEFSAIAIWLARTNPEKNLLPTAAGGEARVMEGMAYAEGTIHGQGYGRLVVPRMFEPRDVVDGAFGRGLGSVKKQGPKWLKRLSRSSTRSSVGTNERPAAASPSRMPPCSTSSAGRRGSRLRFPSASRANSTGCAPVQPRASSRSFAARRGRPLAARHAGWRGVAPSLSCHRSQTG